MIGMRLITQLLSRCLSLSFEERVISVWKFMFSVFDVRI